MITIGLGSCIGLTLYDPNIRLGAMVRIVCRKAGAGRIDRGNMQILLFHFWSKTCCPWLQEQVHRSKDCGRCLHV